MTKRKRLTPEQLAELIERERVLSLSVSHVRSDIDLETIGPSDYASLRTLIHAAVRIEILASGKSEAACRGKVYRELGMTVAWGGSKRPWRRISRHDLCFAVHKLGEMITASTETLGGTRTRLKLVN